MSHSVAEVGFGQVGGLGFVLHGLHGLGGVGAVQQADPGGDAGEDLGVHLSGAQHHRVVGGKPVGVGIEAVVGPQVHPVDLQLLQNVRGEDRAVGEEVAGLQGEGQVGQRHRVAVHVTPPEVQQPGDILQTGEEEGVRPFGGHGLPDPLQLVPPGFPGVRLIQGPHGLGGQGGAVGPDLIHQVQPVVDAGPPVLGHPVVPAARPGGHTAAVEAQHLVGLEAVPQELVQGGDPGLAHFHQTDTGVLQLRLRLEEVAAVGPQTGPLGEDQQGPGGAGEAGHVVSTGEVFAHVLAAVEVVGGDEIGVDFMLGHHVPQGL